jgi:hypothetical protein
MRSDADLVIMCDADTIVLRPFSDQVLNLVGRDAIGGVIAHIHFPWGKKSSGDSVADWNSISNAALGAGIEMKYRYTLYSITAASLECPYYINLGFLIGSPGVLRLLHEVCEPIRERVRQHLINSFDAQVGLALAVSHANIPAVALPMRFNFPNDPIADRLYPAELSAVSVLHYLRRTLFDRQKIFSDESAFRSFLELNLEGSNKILQEFIRRLTAGYYPFGVASESSRNV